MASIEVMNVKQANPEAPIEIQLSTSNITYRGPKGDQGPAGPAGRDGAVGYDGKSAYELAVDNGFEGTEVEWLASLKGETGATGPAGAQGPAGQNGTTPVKGTDYFTQQDIADIVAQVPATDIKFLVSSGSGSSTGTSSTLLSGLSAADKTYLLDAYNDQLKNTRYFVIQDTTGALYYPLTTYSMRLVFLGGISFQNYYYLKFDNVPPSATTIQRWDKEDVVPNWGAIKAGSTAADPFNSSANTSVADAFSYINANFATKSYVENIVRAAQTGMLKRQVVQVLPQSDIDDYTIYMVPKTGSTGDVYNEFLYMDNTWELIGNTQVDLTNYALKSEIPDITGKQDALVFNTAYNASSNKVATMSDITTAVGNIPSGNSYTAGDGISIDNNNVISNIGGSAFPIPYTYNWIRATTKDSFLQQLKTGKIVYSGYNGVITPSDITSNRSYFWFIGGSLSNNKTSVQKVNSITISSDNYYFLVRHDQEDSIYCLSAPEAWARYIPVDLTGTEMGTYRSTLRSLFDNKQNRLTAGTGITISNNTISADSQLPAEPVNDGTYKLNCSISSGASTYSWATDSGGGGSSYTAGRGISISSNNEISAAPMDKCILPLLISLVDGFTGILRSSFNVVSVGVNDEAKTDFVNAIHAGELVEVAGSGDIYWRGLGTDLKNVGYDYLLLVSDTTSGISSKSFANSLWKNWRPNKDWVYWRSGTYVVGMPNTGLGTNTSISKWIYYNNSSSNLVSTTMQGAIDELAGKVPAPSTTDGTYVLQCVVSSGTPTYSWVSAS